MTPRKFGLIAGWGRYPVVVAEQLVRDGHDVYCLAVKGHADEKLNEICTDVKEIGVAKVGAQIRYFKKNGVKQATMAGKIFKTLLFERWSWWKHLPDVGFWRYFSRQFLLGSADRKDDTLLGTYTIAFQKHGITLAPATDYAPDLLVKKNLMGKRSRIWMESGKADGGA